MLGTPVTGGNVSFYNENPQGAVYPTPVIGMLGLLESLAHSTPSAFQREGNAVALLSAAKDLSLGGSSYLKALHGKIAGRLPELDLDAEKRLQDSLLAAIKAGIINSAHDVSDGGLAIALAECCLTGRRHLLGVKVKLEDLSASGLFSEAPSRVIVSLETKDISELVEICRSSGIECFEIGETGGDSMEIAGFLTIAVTEMEELYFNRFE